MGRTSAEVNALNLRDDKVVHVNVRNLRLFNSGAFSNVYRGDLLLSEGRDQEIVIKKTWSSKEENKANTVEIAILKMLNRMNHKNTVKLLYFYTTDYAYNTCYSLIFEFLPLNLYQYIKQFDRKTSLVEIKMFMWQLFRGLHHLERASIIHRDIKPQNLLVDPASGLLKIGDFGSSCMDPKGPQPSYHVTRYYRPPELLLGSRIYGPEVDVWSAGCVFAELLGGRVIFVGKSTAGQMEAIMNALGVPTLDEVSAMNANVGQFREARKSYSARKSTSFKKLLPSVYNQCTTEAVILVQRILQYNPHRRLSGQELLKDAFFADIWDKNTRRPNGKSIGCLTLQDKKDVDAGDKSMTASVDLSHE